ncbi:hypothetical protein ACFL0L_04140 [Patescibacteria group bacterium]
MNFPYIEFIVLFLVIIVFGTAANASIKAAPWLPVRSKDMKRIIALSEPEKHDLIYDLGSGDGRILVALAQNSRSRVVGFEISLIPYIFSYLRMFLSGVMRRVEVRFGDFLKRDLSNANLIFCFLTPMAMKKLAPKFRHELKPGTCILSYAFSLPGWVAKKVDKPEQDSIPIFVYEVPPRH